MALWRPPFHIAKHRTILRAFQNCPNPPLILVQHCRRCVAPKRKEASSSTVPQCLPCRWKRRIEWSFIWLYYLTRNVWVLFLAFIYFSRYASHNMPCITTHLRVKYATHSMPKPYRVCGGRSWPAIACIFQILCEIHPETRTCF